MPRISERDLVLPALYLIAKNPGVSTSQLIAELTELLRPTGDDAEILAGRSDSKFSQIVRNLVSHHTLDQEGLGLTVYEHRSGQGYHRITEEGKAYFEGYADALDYLLESGLQYAEAAQGLSGVADAKDAGKSLGVVPDGLQIAEGARKFVSRGVIERSRRLRQAALEEYSENGVIRCAVCGFDFAETYGEIGHGFIEMHHLRPLFQYEGQADEQFVKDAIEGLVPLCSNCHRMVHTRSPDPFTVEELRAIVEANRQGRA
jgi:5-methylcytosine-specific restriction endonuclease McrA